MSDAPDLPTVAATLLAYVQSSGATGASAVLETGTLEADPLGLALFEPADTGMPETVEPGDARPVALDVAVRPLPALRVDADRGEVSGPLGALEHLALGARALARALGGRRVALVEFAAEDGETTFAIAAREGEGLVLVIGEDQYEMAAGWPAER